jgi:glycosyltransferase involved in cell wall biosynthesis
VERRDVAGISAVLSELLADAPQRARLGEAGRVYTRNLSWSAIAERHEEVYEVVLEKKKSGRRANQASGPVPEPRT